MISGALPRGLAVLECLARHPEGVTLSELCAEVDVPKAATLRALSDLVDAEFARHDPEPARYLLSIKMPALALRYLNQIDSIKLVRPALKKLAEISQEHVRMAIVEGDRLVFIAHEQGSKSALRFSSEAGVEPRLFTTATGVMWLSGFPEEKAVALMSAQGAGSKEEHGPNAPSSIKEFLDRVEGARADGFAMVEESNEIGVSGVAVPVRDSGDPEGRILCVLTIAGPSPRFTRERMTDLVPLLKSVSQELGPLLTGLTA